MLRLVLTFFFLNFFGMSFATAYDVKFCGDSYQYSQCIEPIPPEENGDCSIRFYFLSEGFQIYVGFNAEEGMTEDDLELQDQAHRYISLLPDGQKVCVWGNPFMANNYFNVKRLD